MLIKSNGFCECQARATFINKNSNPPIYYQFTISANKCGGSCNYIDDPCDRISVPDKVKSINIYLYLSTY